jgi:NAD(P)-dependent dehydrogenase (short-subunit alcohol dehydrogenase family)
MAPDQADFAGSLPSAAEMAANAYTGSLPVRDFHRYRRMIHTGMTEAVYSDPTKRAERARHIPLQRVGTPEDVARVVTS